MTGGPAVRVFVVVFALSKMMVQKRIENHQFYRAVMPSGPAVRVFVVVFALSKMMVQKRIENN